MASLSSSRSHRVLLATAMAVLCTACAHAQEGVPLALSSTTRDVKVTLRVGSDAALVRESAGVYVPEGKSYVRFEWTDADIDPASVRLYGPDELKIGGVRQSAGAQKSYSWPVLAERSGTRVLTASYFLKGMKWSASYYLTFDAQEKKAQLVGKLHLTNDSKLPLRNANLELCAAPAGVLDTLGGSVADGPSGTYAAVDSCTLEPGCQRRITFLQAADLPCRVLYRADPEAQKTEVRGILMVDLCELAVPGTLPKGHMEVYENTPEGCVPLVGTDLVHAADKETEVFVGAEPDIVFERTLMGTRKTDVEFDRLGRVSGFDTADDVTAVFRNRLQSPVDLELVEKVPGKWDATCRPEPTKREANEMRWALQLEPGGSAEVAFTVVKHTGSRAD